MLGQDLQGSTVGIFGLGNIGQATVKRLMGFEVGRFIYTGHSRKKAGTRPLREYFFQFPCSTYLYFIPSIHFIYKKSNTKYRLKYIFVNFIHYLKI